MPNTYNKVVVEAFLDKLQTLKKYEESNLEFEKSLSQQEQSNLVRQVYVAAYNNIISMFEDHFKLSEDNKPRKHGGGRPKGSTNKPKVEQGNE